MKGWLGEMRFNKSGGKINWFPGHMAAATRAIRHRLKLSDLVIEVRDARIPLSSANDDLQPVLSEKRRVLALNKKDLANPNIMHRWIRYFDSCKQDCLPINAHSRSSVQKKYNIMPESCKFLSWPRTTEHSTEVKGALDFLFSEPDVKGIGNNLYPGTLKFPTATVKIEKYMTMLLDLVELKLKEVIRREPTLLVMVVGVPNVGKSALINSIHQIALSRFPVQQKMKRATVGPLPGVTQDIAGYKIAHQPSIYVLDTPGVLVPSIRDIETGLKLAIAGSVKDSVVGEERIVQYLLAVLNTRRTPLHWRYLIGRESEGLHHELDDKPEYNLKDLLPKRRKPPNKSDIYFIEDMVIEVQRTLYTTLSEFNGSLDDEDNLETLIDQQFEALQSAMKIPYKASEARTMVSKKFLTLFRTGKLGPFILDDVPDAFDSVG